MLTAKPFAPLFSLIVLLFWFVVAIECGVFSPQNIKYDFTGWRPLPDRIGHRIEADPSQQTITIPVAIETDEGYELSADDLNAIEDRVVETWRRKQAINTDKFSEHLSPFMSKLMAIQPRRKQIFADNDDDNETYTFVKMASNEKKQSSDGDASEVLFHAYLADGDHVPDDGYVRLTKAQFKQMFSDAEIHFV